MKRITLLTLLLSVLGFFFVHAQQQFKGIVLEYGSDELMPQVQVKNLNSQDSVLTTIKGEFTLPANKDDILVFSYPGYRVDSLVVLDYDLKRVYLTAVDDPRFLKEVNVTAITNSRLAEEKERVRNRGQYANTVSGGSAGLGPQRMGGIGLSPSRIFGKEAREARRQYKMLETESNNRIIDARFTPALIQRITPLKGEDLSLFMAKYRPKVSFIKEADDEQLRLYIIDAYNKYKKLSPVAKEKIKLTQQQDTMRAQKKE